MAEDAKQICNPYSTGGGGSDFEVQVQASFVALMLAGGFAPCLPCRPIQKIKLQGRYAGYNTDDLIVFTADADGSQECKLLGQVKHSISITASDTVFREVIQAAWNDFNNSSLFKQGNDAIALITGPLSATDIADVRTILEWARSSESAQEFLTKVETTKFSSKSKQEKLKAFRIHLDAANGNAVSDRDLVLFLRGFHLLGYDLDIRSGVMHAILHSLLGQYSQVQAPSRWTQIVQEVMYANQNAGTITRESLPDDLRTPFTRREIQMMPHELARTLAPREAHAWDNSEYAPTLVIANLLGAWSDKSEADKAIIAKLTHGEPNAWLSKIREVLHLADSPISQRNGVWTVKSRGGLWSSLGSRVFDEHLEIFKDCAATVLKERDPQFDLEPDQRLAAAIYGKVLTHSSHLRKGLADTLALLGSRPECLDKCSQRKAEDTAELVVCDILREANWIRWASVNDLLPLFAEAAPDELLAAVEHELSAGSGTFAALFAQEGGGIGGTNYLTGLLWALETLSWDKRYLVRATLALGAIAERDPGGQWANRPLHSLTTIFLPWLPQTTAPLDKRKVAVLTLLRESPGSAWRLLLTLLPDATRTSGYSRRPAWRKSIPDDWQDHPTDEEYWKAIDVYAGLTVEIAEADMAKLGQLIEHLNRLPKPLFERILRHASSPIVTQSQEQARFEIWSSLTRLARKHRRHADAEWALPGSAVSQIEACAAAIAPTSLKYIYRNLFSEEVWDLYERNEDSQKHEHKIATRRQEAIHELHRNGGVDAVVDFVDTVEFPEQVGLALGLLGIQEAENRILPRMLHSDNDKHKQLAVGYVRGRHQREGWDWVDRIDTESWSKSELGQLLVRLPFESDTWEQADRILGDNAAEYWRNVAVKPYRAREYLNVVVDKLLEHGRPRAAIDCLAHVVRDKQALDGKRAIKALMAAATSKEPTNALHTDDVTTLIQTLQGDSVTNEDDLLKIEWVYLPLLDRYGGVTPQTLERRLASDPGMFCELIRIVFYSDKEEKTVAEASDEAKNAAHNAYRLLDEWRTVPGVTPGGAFSETTFKQWIEAVKKSCDESGHLKVALLQVGKVLIYCPPDPDGLWMARDVADVLNMQDMDELRRGYCLAVYNSRGAHSVDPTGKPERGLAKQYRQQAEHIENAGYHRIATILREVADEYDRQAERIVARHKTEPQGEASE